MGRRPSPTSLILVTAAALALADASVVALALPAILSDLDTTVEGVAAVLGVYALVLALSLLPAEWLRRAIGARALGTAGLALLGAASLGCAVAQSLSSLLVFRGLQALGASAALVATFELTDGGRTGRRLWILAAVGGTAAGPALGGILTQAFDWRAIFIVQVPVALAAAFAALLARPAAGAAEARSRDGDTFPRYVPPDPGAPPEPEPARPLSRLRAGIALAGVSAALAAVLFLLVLLLVTGWSIEPLEAALIVSVLPVAALAGTRAPGTARQRALAGCLLLAGGVAALAWLATASVWWTILPQVLAGLGTGLALPALAGELLPEDTPADAAFTLTLRAAGITAVLLLLGPVVATRLDDSIDTAQLRGTALVLDAKLPPQKKLRLAPALLTDVNTEDPRGELSSGFAARAGDFEGEERAVYDDLRERADETLTIAVGDSFRPAFLIAAAFALFGAVVLLPVPGQRGALALTAATAVALPAAYAILAREVGPEPVTIANPCQKRDLPSTGGIGGFIQDAALVAVDRAACRWGSSREELVLALVDEGMARRYEREHGVDPRKAFNLLQGVLGL